MGNESELENVVLLVIDCGRFDRFENRNAATFINAIADNGIKFTNAISPYNQTKSAMASMFTGKYVSEHRIMSHRDERFDVDQKVLAEVMKDRGYNTIGVNAMYWMNGMFGWGRGFDKYGCVATLEEDAGVQATVLFDTVKQHLVEPFFLYMHLGDIHTPYKYPKAIRSEFQDDYDASLKFLDMQFQSIMSQLPENTKYIITADHGVGLGEHNGNAWAQGPNAWLYEEAIHVPFISYKKGITPIEVSEMVSTKDIFSFIINDALVTNTFVVSESYAYHHESCINTNLNNVGRERAMKGYRCIVDADYKLIEGEDKDLYFFNREDEDIELDCNNQICTDMVNELNKISSMNLKERRQDIVAEKMKRRFNV